MADYVGSSLQDILLKEIIKNCEKLRSQGNGCFDCRYSSDCFSYDCRIGEPWTWDLNEEESEIHEEVDE